MKNHNRAHCLGQPRKASTVKEHLITDMNEVRKYAYRNLGENLFQEEEIATAKVLRNKNAWYV